MPLDCRLLTLQAKHLEGNVLSLFEKDGDSEIVIDRGRPPPAESHAE